MMATNIIVLQRFSNTSTKQHHVLKNKYQKLFVQTLRTFYNVFVTGSYVHSYVRRPLGSQTCTHAFDVGFIYCPYHTSYNLWHENETQLTSISFLMNSSIFISCPPSHAGNHTCQSNTEKRTCIFTLQKTRFCSPLETGTCYMLRSEDISWFVHSPSVYKH